MGNSRSDRIPERGSRGDLLAEAQKLRVRTSLMTWDLAVVIETAARNVAQSRQSRAERRYLQKFGRMEQS